MLIHPADFFSSSLRRGGLALAVVLVHLGLIILAVWGTTLYKHNTETPMLISMVAPPARAPEDLKLPKPAVTFIRPLIAPVPEVQVSIHENEIPASSPPSPGAAAEQSLPAAGPAARPAPDFKMMSEVAYVQRPMPSYPRESRLAHEEGLVVLKVLIDEAGRARDIDVFRSSGHPRLDKEACAAVARALFKPYVDGGVAKAAIAMVPIEFSLHGRSS